MFQLDEKTTKEFWEHFNLAKLAILNKKHFAFIGSMLYKLKVEPELSIKDVCLDGSHSTIRVNPFWFTKLSPEESASMLAHEVMHYALQHDIRRGNRIPSLYQKAADQVVNNMLMDFGFKLPSDIEVDRRYQNQNTDIVYKQIYDEWENEQEEPDNNNSGENDLPEEQPPVTNKQQNQRNRDINQSDLADKASGGRGISNSNEVFKQLFEDINTGKLNWKLILAEHFNELTQGEPSYYDLDRRMLSLDYYEPINESTNTINRVALALDVSGSVSQEQIQIFLQEIRAIIEQLNPEKISVMTFNHRIVDVFEFNQGDDLSSIQINIGGGTDFEPIFEHYNKPENIPEFLIVFSDLEVWWDNVKQPKYHTTFICFDNPKEQAPFGKTIHVKTQDLEC